MKNKQRSYKIRASWTNHSNLEFQYQQSTLILDGSPFKEI